MTSLRDTPLTIPLDPTGLRSALLYVPDGGLSVEDAQRVSAVTLAWVGVVPVPSRADRLLSEAMYLGQFGERPPGGENATWADWFRQTEAYLRERTNDGD